MAKRRNFTNQFKAKVELEALRGDETVQESSEASVASEPSQHMEATSHRRDGRCVRGEIGRLAVENDSCRKGSRSELRKRMVDDPTLPPQAEHQPAM